MWIFQAFKISIVSKHTNNSFKNEVNEMIRSEKNTYILYNNIFNNSMHDIRKSWKIDKIILGSVSLIKIK